MQLIIQSYLKTFWKHWVSTLGTLLFIIMLACVVLGLMSTPLQLQMRIEWARTHSTSYDWKINTKGINYSETFAFDYFVLNGYNYTTPTDTHSDYLLNPWSEEAEVITPNEFGDFLAKIKNGSINLAVPTSLNGVLLNPSFYLFVDQWALNYINDGGSRIPPELVGVNWWDYFDKYDKVASNQTRLFLRNFFIDFTKFITTATKWADSSATIKYTYKLNETNGVTTADQIAHYFVNDLTSNVTLKLTDGNNWFTTEQQLYLYNVFLTSNDLAKISSAQAWNPQTVISQLISQANESKQLTGIALEIFNSKFRDLIVNHYKNKVSAYLVSTALTTLANPESSDGGQERYAVQSKLAYSLSEVIPGSFTPSFSTNVRAIGEKDTYNHVLIDQGREPVYDPGYYASISVREIVVSPSFLKQNKLKLGDKLTLPKAEFADNIDRNDVESQDVAGTNSFDTNIFTIVGTGFAYDELIPGSSFLSFLQPLRNYTYSYLPNNYFDLYYKASFLYYEGTVKNHPITVVNNVRNLQGNHNPYNALMRSEGLNLYPSYAMFYDATDLVTRFSQLSTVSGLNIIKIQLLIYIALGLVSLILAFIFINFIIKKEINETRRQLGIFKSFGYGIAELSLIFATKTLITIAIGIIIGWICSIPLQFFMASNFKDSVMFTYQRLYLSPVLLITLFVFIPLLFTAVSYLLTLSYLREPALLLINNRQKMPSHKPHNGVISRTLEKHNKGFKYRLSSSFVKTAIGKFVVVQLLFGFSALLYTLIFGARTVMYQVINQSFNQVNSKTDHEYSWSNRNSLIINETTGGRYSMQNIDNWAKDKVNYINYQNYASPVAAMNDVNNPAINSQLNLTRYSFRALFDALSNSVVQRVDDTMAPNLDNWWLLPQTIALERYAEGYNWNPNLATQNYYLYKVLLFKGTDYQHNSALISAMQNMKDTNQPYANPVTSSDFNGSWLSDNWGSPTLVNDLKTTFLGLISQDFSSNRLANNFFLTDLSRLIAMILAENYITTELKTELRNLSPGTAARYPPSIVIQALQNTYQKVYSGKLAKFDPRNSLYWGFNDDNPLVINPNQLKGATQVDDNFNMMNIFKDLKGLTFGLLAAAMISEQAKSMLTEPIINFNNFFYNASKEQLQLQLSMTPENTDWGKTSLLLSDFNKNSPYGSPDNVYNFEGVSAGQWAQMLIKPGAPDEPYFNGILPYAVAQLYNVKVGDIVHLQTKTSNPIPIDIQVIAINRSVTLPLSESWQINVDYNTFAKVMFTQQLQDALGIGNNQPLSPYYFNGLISQNPMVDGKINIMGIGESLADIHFVGDQLTVSLAEDKLVFSSLWQTLIDYLLIQVDQNPSLPPDIKDEIRKLAMDIRSSIKDTKELMLTNPMVLDSGDSSSLVSIPYNLARIGIRDFAGTMNQLMLIFLLLQSVLLTITLIVVMNIVVDEASIIILTLRSLGYSHNEINWIIMGPYVFWVIVSFVIAYAISLIAWRVLLTFARNRWGLIIHFRFSIMDLVVPFCVLAVIMLIGWFASDYSVHRRSLTQITDSA